MTGKPEADLVPFRANLYSAGQPANRSVVGLKTLGFDDSRCSAVEELIVEIIGRRTFNTDQIAQERAPGCFPGDGSTYQTF